MRLLWTLTYFRKGTPALHKSCLSIATLNEAFYGGIKIFFLENLLKVYIILRKQPKQTNETWQYLDLNWENSNVHMVILEQTYTKAYTHVVVI